MVHLSLNKLRLHFRNVSFCLTKPTGFWNAAEYREKKNHFALYGFDALKPGELKKFFFFFLLLILLLLLLLRVLLIYLALFVCTLACWHTGNYSLLIWNAMAL